MMRIQYESLIKQIYKMVDEELELDTREGNEVFCALTLALFQFHPEVMKAEERVKEC